MTAPPDPPDAPDPKAPRYDLKQVRIFRRALLQRPWLGLLLCLVSVLAGAALAFGWVGRSTSRRDATLRAWIAAVIWWLFGAWVGAESVRGFMQRRAETDKDAKP
ncbi:MAG: hypothetical protein H7242_12240 [Microbacteriaceae bacterium]|nr:hypothetical protein [Burkholderiaceae bacterium]